MKRRLCIGGTGLLVLLLFLWILPNPSQAKTRKVDCSNPKKTLQKAIDKAKPADSILVSGICNENVNIGGGKNDLTVDGQGGA